VTEASFRGIDPLRLGVINKLSKDFSLLVYHCSFKKDPYSPLINVALALLYKKFIFSWASCSKSADFVRQGSVSYDIYQGLWEFCYLKYTRLRKF
jgi:hypothetical protein